MQYGAPGQTGGYAIARKSGKTTISPYFSLFLAITQDIEGNIERRKETNAMHKRAGWQVKDVPIPQYTITIEFPLSQPGVGGGGEPSDAGIANIAASVKLTKTQLQIMRDLASGAKLYREIGTQQRFYLRY